MLIPALLVDLVLALMLRGRGAAFWLVLVAFFCMAGTLAIFFVWTDPANVATDQWTTIPDDWASLRRQWEYSHAVNAVVTFVSLCCLTAAVIILGGESAREIAPH